MRHLFLPALLVLIAPAATAAPAAPADPFERLTALSPYEMDEVLWLARCVLSESDRAAEQRYVAWVVRNRVETGYRGAAYREVVLEPYQFSAFNKPSERRRYLLALNQNTRSDKAWQNVVEIALDVYRAPATARPFPVETRHFYSPISMPGGATPSWAEGRTPVAVSIAIDDNRFRFYEGVDYAADMPWKRAATVQDSAKADSAAGADMRTTRIGKRLEAHRARLRTTVQRPQRPAGARSTGSGQQR